jgi:hypothetical protein
MALSTKHRLALYEHFVPQVGDEVTEALLAEFPAHDGDELVTRDHLRAELAEVRKDMAEMRTEMHQLSDAANRRMATLVLTTLAVLLTAGGIMTSVIISAVG